MKTAIIGVVVAALLGVGGWFYATNVNSTNIAKITQNPAAYEGKQLIISGTVTDAVSLLIVKYYSLRDKTGEMVVVTKRSFLPRKGDKLRVKGHIEDAFSLGDQQLVVFVEDPR